MEEVKLKESVEKGPETVSEGSNEEVDFAPMIDYFGMERPSLEEKNDLRELIGLLGTTNKVTLLTKLRQLEIKIGMPPTSENRLKRIIRVLDIDRQVGDLLKEQEAYVK